MTFLGTVRSSDIFEIAGELNAGRPSTGMTEGEPNFGTN